MRPELEEDVEPKKHLGGEVGKTLSKCSVNDREELGKDKSRFFWLE